MIYPYLSINAAGLLPLFMMERSELRPLALAVAVVTLAAAAIFVLFPARVEFARPAVVVGHELVYRALYQVDLPYNSLPSLHVAFSALWMLAVSPHASALGRVALGAWFLLLAASTMLTHQHHLTDVVAGAALGGAGYLCYSRWAAKSAKASPAAGPDWAGSSAAARPTSAGIDANS
jgi:membrane-associated phospholipid phosphatase